MKTRFSKLHVQPRSSGRVCMHCKSTFFNDNPPLHCRSLKATAMKTRLRKLHTQPKIKREGMYALQINFLHWQSASSLPSPSGDGNEDTSQQIACATQNQEGGHLHYKSTFFNYNPHLHCRRLQATEIVELKCKFAISTQLLSSKRISKKELKIKIKFKIKFKCAA